jgi:hypothetical protein
MEKSIENIWKEGFLSKDSLIVPKVNNLYTQKSKHIIDKITRMFKKNLVAIFWGSLLFMIISFFIGIPVAGIMLFIISNIIVVINKKLQKESFEIDVKADCYQYIKSFDRWLKNQLDINAKMAKVYYPLIFLSVVIGFWYSDFIKNIIEQPNQIYLVKGVPIFWLSGALLISAILYLTGEKLYRWDINIVYGRVFKKLEELLLDMEELREE